jgi:hypothetical protein
MTMYIVSGPHEYLWHVGENIDNVKTFGKLNEINEIQADGDEYVHIVNNFRNLPISGTKIIKWKAPWAQFIVDNFC